MNDSSAARRSRRAKVLLIVGLSLLVMGLLCNQWTLAFVFSSDRTINDIVYLTTIWILQFTCIGFGVLLVLARKQAVAGKLLLSAISLLIVSPVLLEFGLRAAIMLGVATFRDPALYADPLADDDYWKLQCFWTPNELLEGKPAFAQDPDLGWRTPSTATNPLGIFAVDTASPRYEDPALLFYGDSFVDGFKVLEDQLSPAVREALPYPVYNFGVPGYGIDQSLLRLQKTHADFHRPRILFGILTYDIDRCLLSIRGAPKPYFVVQDDELQLRGVPVPASTSGWIAEHPPQTRSFLKAFVTQQYKRHTQDWSEGPYRRDAKRQLAARLLQELAGFAEQSELPLTVAIFYTPREIPMTGWREQFLLEQCQSLGLEVIDTKPILMAAAAREGLDVESFYKPDDHMNDQGNCIVAQAIVEHMVRCESEAPHHGTE